MAIEIIPKEAAKLPLWQNILFYISVALILVCILGYFVLDYFTKKSDLMLQDLEKALAEAKTPQQIALEEEILDYRKKIEDFSSLFLSHKKSSNFFNSFEEITHPEVFFSEVSLDIIANQIELTGKAENIRVLGEQLLMFQNTEFIRNLSLPEVGIGKEGKIEFVCNFSLNPTLFK